MALQYTYDAENKFLLIKISGALIWDELKQLAFEIASSSEFPSTVNTLYDMREMDFSNVTAEFEEKVIAFRKQLKRGDAKIACLVSSDVGFGMGRMYEVLSEGLPQQVRVFKNHEEAQSWLISDKQS